MAPAVSIITPSFNRHELLQAQHAIVAAQTVTDFEWLILDDGPEPCAYFAGLSDPRIRYHHLHAAPSWCRPSATGCASGRKPR